MRIITLSVIAFIALLVSVTQQSEIHRLRNKLTDANLEIDLDKAQQRQIDAWIKKTSDTLAAISNEMLLESQFVKKTTAVNEKQGAHNFVYVESDSWVDLATGEKVPAMRKIAPPTPILIDRIRAFGLAPSSNSFGTGGWNQ